MGKRATFSNSVELNGRVYRPASSVVEGDSIVSAERSGDNPLPAAKSGSLTTRTNNTDGTLTMGAGHGIVTGARLDVYWSGGSRYGCTVGAVSGNDVPISGGAGDNLPPAATAVTAMTPISVPFTVTGNNAIMVLATMGAIGTVVFREAAADALAIELLSPGEVYAWKEGTTNPLAGKAVTNVLFSQAGTATTTAEANVLLDY